MNSDEEHVKVRVGDIPKKWYNEEKHIGYDTKGKQIIKPKNLNNIEKLIEKEEDPNFWKTIFDEENQKKVVLTNKQLNLINRIRKNIYHSKELDENDDRLELDPYDFIHPMNDREPAKNSFKPSKWNRKKINNLVDKIKRGLIKIDNDEKIDEEENYDIWDSQHFQNLPKLPPALQAPKLKLPDHDESYNPSGEFLPTEEEKEKWLNSHPDDREKNYLPNKLNSFREIEGYDNFIKERFDRCMDLYLAPRILKKKVNIDPKTLIPKLPDASNLKPFPSFPNIEYLGHNSRIRAIDLTNTKLLSVSEVGEIIIFDIMTSRILFRRKNNKVTSSCKWINDNEFVIGIENYLEFYSLNQKNYELEELEKGWEIIKDDNLYLKIELIANVLSIDVHKKGDYIGAVCQSPSPSLQVSIHSLKKGKSNFPFKKIKGICQKIIFHHLKPIIFLATQKNIFIYNLQTQSLIKKLLTGCKWISSISLHPKGENLISGSFDRKLVWHDLEIGDKPLKTLKIHDKAVRSVNFHTNYPLFASCSDDGKVIVQHGMVYDDYYTETLIVPLKILKGHKIVDNISVLDLKWHKTKPWLFTAGADYKIIMWC